MKVTKSNTEFEIPDSYYKIQIIEDELNKIQGGFPNNYNGIFDELESIKLLISKIGELVLHEKETKRKRKEILNKGEEHEVNDVFESTSKPLKFREYTYNSLLFLIHMLLEKYVVHIAELINHFQLNPQSKFPNKLRSNIDKFYDFIYHNLSNDSSLFIELDLFKHKGIYTEIRNALYHRNGKTDDQKIKAWIEHRDDIEISKSNTVSDECDKADSGNTNTNEFYRIRITNSSFLISYINDVEFYFKKLFVLIRTRYYSAYDQGKF
ncbi:MAG: hypothetical protein IPQ19_01485 [Bacteroidetes bacterium]|nr:hypothetical protein [Bacteroidota bacterium]